MNIDTPRIAPVDPPYEPDVAAILAKWMPPNSGLPPLALFRTLARHPMLRDRLRPLGAGLLGQGTLSARVRELMILRTSARCGARYEWGVHVTAFAAGAGLEPEAVRATALASPADVTARDHAARDHQPDDDAFVLRIADELHDTATLSPPLFARAVTRFGDAGVLELAALAGYYHLIAFVIGVAGLDAEPWAERFPAP